MKQILSLLLCIGLLAGCGTRLPATSDSSAPSEAASSASSAQSEAEPVEMTPATMALQRLVQALETGDISTLEQIADPSFGTQGKLDYWKTVKLAGPVEITSEQLEAESGLAELVLYVAEPGETPLKVGENEMVVYLGYATFSNQDQINVLMMMPKDKYLTFDQIKDDRALSEVSTMRGLAFFELFDSPENIDREQLLEYVIILTSWNFSDNMDEPLYELTQEQIDTTAEKYFGVKSIDGKDTRYYNAEKKIYELMGRGGMYRNERLVRVADNAEGNRVVWLESYDDQFQLVPTGAVCYTLAPNGDGSYRFLSAVEVDAVPK